MAYYSDEMDDDWLKETAVTVTQFILKPDIPLSERVHFQRFYLLFSKISALSNIRRDDMKYFMLLFDEIVMAFNYGLYSYARELIARFITALQLSRSVGGFQTLYGRGVQRVENIEKIRSKVSRNSARGRIRDVFFGRKEREKVEMTLPGLEEEEE